MATGERGYWSGSAAYGQYVTNKNSVAFGSKGFVLLPARSTWLRSPWSAYNGYNRWVADNGGGGPAQNSGGYGCGSHRGVAFGFDVFS